MEPFTTSMPFPDRVMFNTKWIPTGSSPKNLTVVRDAVDKSRRRMHCPSLDLLQMYWWDYDKRNYVEMIENAQVLVTQGLISGVAVTGFDRKHLTELVDKGVPVVCAQGSCSIVDTRALDGDMSMSRYCSDKQIALVCHGSLLGGFLTQEWLGAPEPLDRDQLANSQLRKYYKWLQHWGEWSLLQELLTRLDSIARKHSSALLRVSIANVAMRWVLQQHGVTSVVVGARLGKTSTRRHLEENTNVFAFELDLVDLHAIAAIQAKARPLRQYLGDVGDEFHKKNKLAKISTPQR